MPRNPKWIAPIVAIGAAVLVVASVEAFVRIAKLAPEVKFIGVTQDDSVYRRSTNPTLGFELKANYRNPSADCVTSYPRTNSHGQRDYERALEKSPGIERILVSGASIVEGFGLCDLDETITGQLQSLYAGAAEVLNFGVSAYCTKAKVELLKTKGVQFSPDVVVLVISQNDFNNFNHEAFQLGSPVTRPWPLDDLFETSHLFRFVTAKFNLFHFGIQTDPIQWNREAIGDNNVVEGMEAFANLAEQEAFAPIVAVWPRFTESEIQDLHPMPDGSGALVVERIAQMYGIPSFRFSTHYQAHLDRLREKVRPVDYYTLGDLIHPNASSAQLAALALKTELDRLATRPDRFLPGRRTAVDPDVIEVAKSLGAKDPHRSRILVNLGNTLLSQGRFEEASEQYLEALELKPDLAEARANLGVAYRRLGRHNDALKELVEALRLDPDLAQAHANVGATLLEVGDFTRAAKAFSQALQLAPNLRAAQDGLAAARQAIEGRKLPADDS